MKSIIYLLPIIAGLVLFNGCSVMSQGAFGMSLADSFPPPYTSSLHFTATGEKHIKYEIVGEGYGEAIGYSIFMGAIYYRTPDAMEAYRMAVDSQGGDFLIESRRQLKIKTVLSPIIWTKATLKVWGLVAKIEK